MRKDTGERGHAVRRAPRLVAVTIAVLIAFPAGVWADDGFTDVPNGNTHHDAINAIRDAGITLGCAAGLYCPSDPVRRDQMASFMDRLGALSGQTPVVNAATAQTADDATNATNADNAANAANADLLDGFDSADFRFINLPIYGAVVSGGATLETGSFGNAGIEMPDGASSSFAQNFTVPPDYTPGDTLTVHLTWYTPATSCDIDLRPNFTSFARVGETFPGGGASAGLQAVGGNILTAPGTARQVEAKQFTIDAPDAIDLEPLDSVSFGLFRAGGGAADTCADALLIHGVGITY